MSGITDIEIGAFEDSMSENLGDGSIDLLPDSIIAAMPSENIGAIASDSFLDIYTPMVEVISPLPFVELFAVEDAVTDDEAWESNLLMVGKTVE